MVKVHHILPATRDIFFLNPAEYFILALPSHCFSLHWGLPYGVLYMIIRIGKSRSPKSGNLKTRFFYSNFNKPCCTYEFFCNLSETILSFMGCLPRSVHWGDAAQAASGDSTAHSVLAVQRAALCLIYYNYFNICSEDRNVFVSSEAFLWHSLL